MRIDLSEFQSQVRDAARRAFTELRAAFPDEHFYVYALYTDESVMTVLPAANSEEAWQRKCSETSNTAPAMANYYRWSSGEWAYESRGDHYFQTAQQTLNDLGREVDDAGVDSEFEEEEEAGEEEKEDKDTDDELTKRGETEFEAFRNDAIAAMTAALHDLDAEGFFGRGETREKVMLFVTVSDAEDTLQVENASAQALNSAAAFARFAGRYR